MDVDLIASRIKKARELNNYTLEDIASNIGVARSTIQRYENALIKKPKLPVLQAIADSLHVNPAWLAGQNVAMTKSGYNIQETYNIQNFGEHLKNEEELLKHFSKLNLAGEKEAIKRVYELSMIKSYTDNQEELLELVPGSCKIIKESDDFDNSTNDGSTTTYTSQTYTMNIADLIDEDTTDSIKKISSIDKSHLEVNAARPRTDLESGEITTEMKKHDEDIMDDPNF